MQTTSLAGRSILIVEDEPLIALDIIIAFEKVGAVALTARSLAEAIRYGSTGECGERAKGSDPLARQSPHRSCLGRPRWSLVSRSPKATGGGARWPLPIWYDSSSH